MRLPEQRAGDGQQAEGDERARPDAVGETPGERRDDDDHHRRGQEANAGFQRRVAADVLHVQREEEEHREHGEADDEGDDVGAEERARAEEAEVDHRHGAPALDDREGGQADDGDGEHGELARRAPAPFVALDEREHERGEADREREHAGHVDGALDGLVARLAHGEQRDDDGADGDGKVEEEDRLPADALDEKAADDGADGERHGGNAGPRADRLAALLAAGRRW